MGGVRGEGEGRGRGGGMNVCREHYAPLAPSSTPGGRCDAMPRLSAVEGVGGQSSTEVRGGEGREGRKVRRGWLREA